MRSKADIIQLNLLHGTNNEKVGNSSRPTKNIKRYAQNYRQTVREIRGVSPEEEKDGNGGTDSQKRKVFSLEWKSEWVMDDESSESMEPTEEVPIVGLDESELERLVRG